MTKDEKIKELAWCAKNFHLPESSEDEEHMIHAQVLLERKFRKILGWKERKTHD